MFDKQLFNLTGPKYLKRFLNNIIERIKDSKN